MSIRSPVLFLVFNRPDTTKRVFEAIRAARPPRLYVAADGPRAGKPGEAVRCDEVRAIATAVDWPCRLTTMLRAENLGCKVAPSSAISWFFEQESEGIILEDDCLPDASFFEFCDALLDRYRDEPRVMCISGDNFVSKFWQPDESYYFSNYGPIWGWATWRRAWSLYDVDMTAWRSGKHEILTDLFPQQPRARRRWKGLFDSVSKGNLDAWDYQWLYALWAHGGLSCIPKTNLISNIGFGPGATHTYSTESKLADLSRGSLSTPFLHPLELKPALGADALLSRHAYGIDEEMSMMTSVRLALNDRLRKMRAALGV